MKNAFCAVLVVWPERINQFAAGISKGEDGLHEKNNLES